MSSNPDVVRGAYDSFATAMKLSLLAGLFLLSSVAAAQPPDAAMQREIEALFTVLQHSGCEFYRNGSWYDAERATRHLRRKYDYLLGRDLLTTTESFIERAASESSLSGKPYRVRCDGQAPIDSRIWFTQALDRLRAGSSAGAERPTDQPLH